MLESAVALEPATTQPSLRSRLLAALKPLDSGPREIRALDGLRAIAALSVLGYHFLYIGGFKRTPAGSATYPYWHWLVTGVQLFFVLSGFLLFLPYARAMLRGNPLPSAKRFYQRRALRILPAYWVAFIILAILPTSAHLVPLSLGDVVTHLLMIHDSFPQYSRDLEGPFWTLAVEAQFYMILPLLAAGMARVVGGSRSRLRLVGCLVALLLAAVVVRRVDGILMGYAPSYTPLGFSRGTAILVFVLVTYGAQGKFLDIFAIGMLASLTLRTG